MLYSDVTGNSDSIYIANGNFMYGITINTYANSSYKTEDILEYLKKV